MSTSTPKIEWVGGAKPYKLVNFFQFNTEYGSWVVPAEYHFNGASVPRIPFVYARYGGRALEASCLHDYLYEKKIVDRKTADLAFLELMEYYNNPESAISRKTMYYAVRAFGWNNWNK